MRINQTGWMRFSGYLYNYWKLQAAVIILGLIAVPLGLLNPYLTKLVIDQAYANKDLRLFFILAAIGAGVFLLSGILNSLKNYFSQYINKKVHFEMTRDLFRHLQSLPLSFFNNKSTGEHIFKLSSDVGSVSGFLCNSIPEIIRLYPRSLFILAVVCYLNWKMALLVILLVPLSLLQPYFFGRWLKEISRKMIAKSEGIFRGLGEVFSHIHLVKALGKEDYETKRFKDALANKLNLELQTARVANISGLSNSVLNKLIGGAVVLYGGYQVIKGTMTLGSLTAIMIYLSQFIALIGAAARFHEQIMVNSVACERLTAVLAIRPQVKDRPGARDYPILRGGIGFRDVYFGYKKDEFIFKGMTFSIEPAAKIALVGPSGCGKTTLFALLLRLYGLQSGSILIDGLDLEDISNDSLSRQMSVVLQEPFLWNDSVKNNILYAKEPASMDEIVRAAHIAEADDFIRELPQGYETQVGEYACKISDGQKQRIAIARAVINKAKILILDEATSSLDSQTEDKIIDNIRREFSDSTVLTASHRLSTAQKMDWVYFLESPAHIEAGRHEQLLEKNPKYKQLFSSQIGQSAATALEKELSSGI